MSKRWGAGVVAAALLAASATAADSPPTLLVAGASCGVPPTVRRLPAGLELDTLWYHFAPALRACRVLNRKDRWVAECAWFYMEGPNGGVFRLEQLDSLHARGVVNDSTKFTGVRYRYLVKARSREEAAQVAAKEWPSKVPEAVHKMLLDQVGLNADSIAAARK